MHPDLTGQPFGILVAKRFAGKIGRKALWLCVCDCGGKAIVRADKLKEGRTVSCGCRYEAGPKTHGLSYAPIYSAWNSLKWKARSSGVSICRRWRTFENFAADMQETYRPGLWLCRRRFGDYGPKNCYWGTPRQALSTRRAADRRAEYPRLMAS